jgi:predicted DNA-binding transcriptional regulator AlpA
MTRDDSGELMTTAEVAAFLRAPVSTVRYWRHIATGPASFRLGRRVMYRRVDVDAWIESVRLAQGKAG